MRNLSIALLLALILALVIGFFGTWITKSDSQPLQVAILPSPAPVSNPYLITSMKARQYSSEIKIENKVRQTSSFTSYKVSYTSDGLKQFALMNVPIGNPPASGWPVVIVNHGFIDPEIYSTENSYVNTSAYYAGVGFLVLKPDYRGHDNSEGGAEGLVSRINYAVDVLNLIAAIAKLDTADPGKVFLYGHSMGGDVALRVMEVCGTCVRAASLWAPAVADWPESFLYFSRKNQNPPDPKKAERHARRLKELQELFIEDQYSQVSTFANVNLVKVPVIIHHATADQSVPYEWGQNLSAKFEENNIDYQFYSYQGDNHDIAANWSTALNRDIDLFIKP
ncbi:hypothetical protein A2634_00015 [Candidatus Amesbacteria bacterium RIFCSPHIGHO2_01_FULL_48_32]|uniref:Peptidase S9 prolyl oligopeptidase catalytic domain-containing protein n=1 Tax=Candidatus Amesbacteria bacterium RIFCSPLOWO2_01_FULL_48_25 TaxID=1797259 RepID=A0A1F4ZB60_9BACT|nr:MAG: hypothetical protein A2634_00015 [Candidatus Amesbacteria bacterium RIFCSPHIGHO2_01_FULL_48_32]OGD03146.1 MAG: hypothetical protein A2989_02305 [Candidatus Amesbacteria bacterium RIFCSPLOWO2_01_FULL_48_25]HJZ05555.1 alpha/beta hydrolase [Patescibacteria group bacterium]